MKVIYGYSSKYSLQKEVGLVWVAQKVEQETVNFWVIGSNPILNDTTIIRFL